MAPRFLSGLLGLAFACTGGIGDVPPRPEDECAAGPVVARRLSRAEYNNTVRDLFELDVGSPADAFPTDVPGVNGLTVSDRFLEEHEEAVARMATLAIENGFITCDPVAMGHRECVEELMQPFMERAWRRPVTREEIDNVTRYLDVVAAEPGETEPFRRVIELGIQAVLMSPNFLFRFEPLDDPTTPLATPLGDYELASRLSYFIWETMPDDELFAAAADGTLGDVAGLEAQIDRMLDDPRSLALVDRLTNEWLTTNRIDALNPNPALYPTFDPALLQSMRRETALFVGEFLREDRSYRDMFDADFTYVDDALARHYGLPEAGSLSTTEHTRVSLAGNSQRGGLLTQGSVLVATSVPRNDPTAEVSETNIIVRGQFVLAHLLCTHPPPPPPGLDVSQIQAEAQRDIPNTAPRKVREGVRQMMQPCATCHSFMDPIGFSMEHYDITGAWRETDTLGTAVDTTGVLLGADGNEVGEFDGARSLGSLVREDPRVSHCLTETILRLALGRTLGAEDMCPVDTVAEESDEQGNGLRSLVRSIAGSDAFTHQRGEP